MLLFKVVVATMCLGLLPHCRGRMSKFSLASWSELGVTGDYVVAKVVRPSSDRGSRCTDRKQIEKTEIEH